MMALKEAGGADWPTASCAAVALYEQRMDRYEKLARHVAERARATLADQADLRCRVEWRVKQPSSLQAKLARRYRRHPQSWDGLGPEEILAAVSDLAGARVLIHADADRDAVVEIVRVVCAGDDGSSWVRRIDRKDAGGGYYRATHLDIVIPPSGVAVADRDIAGVACEIQVTSVLAWAANEIEHDLRYKSSLVELSRDETELLEALGAQMVAADLLVEQLLQAVKRRRLASTGPFEDRYDFVERLRAQVDLLRLGVHATQLYEEIERLALVTPRRVADALFEPGWEERARADLEGFNAFLAGRREASEGTRALEADTADLVLVRLFEQRLDEVLAGHPAEREGCRPSTLAVLCHSFKEWQSSAVRPTERRPSQDATES